MKFLSVTLCYCFISLCGADTLIIKSRPSTYYRTNNASSISPQFVHGDKPVNKLVTNSINSLALNLDRILTKCSTKEGNTLFSPLNIVKTLATVMLGAGGITEKELAYAIGPRLMGRSLNKVLPEFHVGMGRLMRHIVTQPGVSIGANIDVASGLFVQNDYPIKQSYKDQANKHYQTEVYSMNFSGDGFSSANFINQWINKKTHGRIEDVIAPPVNPQTKVIFAGALYFLGDWEHPFQEKITKWQTFYLGAEGKYGKEGSVLVEMMVNQAKIPTYENKQLGFQAIGMPYKGGDVIMYVILPKLKTSLQELTCRLKPEDIGTIINKSQPAEVFYVIPKMKLDHESNLRDVMVQVNAPSMFDPQAANFTNLSDEKGLYVSDILHRVNVELNEKGTIAAATTVVSMNRGGYVNFRADRPFLFFIYNAKVGVITFWGSVKKPVPFRQAN